MLHISWKSFTFPHPSNFLKLAYKHCKTFEKYEKTQNLSSFSTNIHLNLLWTPFFIYFLTFQILNFYIFQKTFQQHFNWLKLQFEFLLQKCMFWLNRSKKWIFSPNVTDHWWNESHNFQFEFSHFHDMKWILWTFTSDIIKCFLNF